MPQNMFEQPLLLGDRSFRMISLPRVQKMFFPELERLPFGLRVLLENALRRASDAEIPALVELFQAWLRGEAAGEVTFLPARILMQDFTGVPALVDLASMRDAARAQGKDPTQINPHIPVDLVIDHSVSVDFYGSAEAEAANTALECARNGERYRFLKWAQQAFQKLRVVPPGTGICHQVNLEYLASVVHQEEAWLYPDTVFGTDSHTTMINGLGVLGWGVGGIEAESILLGRPVHLRLPAVVGVELTGSPKEGVTPTDLVLHITHLLRTYGVVDKFVEFYGPAVAHLPTATRATIANMAPEYGATCGLFPVDEETLDYLALTGRRDDHLGRVKAYLSAQEMWDLGQTHGIHYPEKLTLDLGALDQVIAGPKRPQDKVAIADVPASFLKHLEADYGLPVAAASTVRVPVRGTEFDLSHGDVVIAAITSCTNTSNPLVMLAAGLLARKAVERGLQVKPWVKTSLAPGSQVVSDYLNRGGLQEYFDALGFNVVGYGCTTCIGNSGPLAPEIGAAIEEGNLVTTAILSGNRNFEGRINPLVSSSYLASPPLVVAYAIAGSMRVDITKAPLGSTPFGDPIYLKDIWPTRAEVKALLAEVMGPDMYRYRYAHVLDGPEIWQALDMPRGDTYAWDPESTYIQRAPFFEPVCEPFCGQVQHRCRDIEQARILLLLGDSVTTDHISPAGAIPVDSPAGKYLQAHGVLPTDFNAYGARRGNHEVMVRGTFANIRLQNKMAEDRRGGYTRLMPEGNLTTVYEAALAYRARGESCVVFAGREYGTGSSRDWAAKGTKLLGIQAVIAESFERIHRSNLVGMGVLPLTLPTGMRLQDLHLSGAERVSIRGLDAGLSRRMVVPCTLEGAAGDVREIALTLEAYTLEDIQQLQAGGILPAMLTASASTGP